jgi:hypothetical protein
MPERAMPSVTIPTLPDYARHVMAVAEAASVHYPVRRTVHLPELELTAHLSPGTLADALDRAFVQAAAGPKMPPGCRIFVGHPGITGIPAPARWSWGQFTEHGLATQLADAGLRGHFYHDLDFWQFYDPQRRVGVQLMTSADAFPPWEPGAPLRPFLHWEYAARGLRLAHAGTLGLDGKGILLAGSGGAGKSGTVVAGLINGLDSVGDDYVLIDRADRVTARPLFATLKQDPEGFRRLKLKDRLKTYQPLNWQGKHAFHINEIAPRPIPARLDIMALMVPHISGGTKSTIMSISRKDAMIALAPSGVVQMPGEREAGFRFFSEITRDLPCWRLSLGTEPQEIAGVIADFILAGGL